MIGLRDVRVGYGERAVLQVDDLALAPGRITAVIGSNGCGKSTLLRALVGLLPYGGSIRVCGDELRDLPHRERARRVAYLPQVLQAPAMTVRTLVGHGRFSRLGPLQALGEGDERAIRHAMDLCDVWQLRDRAVRDLSGGERQRAYLAMAIAQDAPMLLLDEPGAHLDVAHRLATHRIMRLLASEGKGVVVTSHDVTETFTVCDDVCLIGRGTIKAYGEADRIVTEQDLLADALGVRVRRVEGEGLLFPYALVRAER
ncbi:MAG: ABC transporter ATP-binding protein [Acidobacteriota bacterium]|nr:ABC transporter ATP-binding protein [Acidobacteriota bacterium]